MRLLVVFIISISNNLFSQSIFDIARHGTPKEMTAYLEQHPEDLNSISEHGASPFLLAAYRGNNDVAKLLLEKGADIHYCYAEGSAIYALIYKNNLELLEAVLKKGVNPNDTCQFNQLGYPLHFALSLQRIDAIELLIQYKASTKIKDVQGRSIEELLTFYANPQLNLIFNKNEK